MQLASEVSLFQGSHQVFHIHVLLVALLGASHITKPCTDQHEGRISIWKGPHRAGATADFPIEPLNDIVGTDPCPMLGGKVAIGQRLFNAVLHFLGRLLQLHFPQLGHHGLSFLTLAISTLSDLWYNGGD